VTDELIVAKPVEAEPKDDNDTDPKPGGDPKSPESREEKVEPPKK
jgi:hypothetical protein